MGRSAERPGGLRRRPSGRTELLLFASLALLVPFTGVAQDPAPTIDVPPPDPVTDAGAPAVDPAGERYRVYLLTMGQGSEVWELFGHNALLIRDAASGQDLVWNWGLFDFGDVDFVPRFLQGTMRYTMGPAEFGAFLEAYRRAGRTVYANEVFLTQEEAGVLDEFVRWNYLPENRDYTYDYYRDNCSTRVRDALDMALGGMLRRAYQGRPTPHSYRWHSRRLVQGTTWVDQGLSFMVGTPGDRPVSEWEAMFLPLETMRLLEDFERLDGTGGTRPLLGPREVLHQADRPEVPAAPPTLSPAWILLGLAGAALFGALGAAARARPSARTGLRGAVSLWGMFSGVLGMLLVLAWFTDHEFAQWNANLFYASPLGLALAAVSVLAVFLRHPEGADRIAARLAAGIAAGSVLMALVEATPWVGQGNGEVLAVAIPINVAVAWALQGSEPTPRVAGSQL